MTVDLKWKATALGTVEGFGSLRMINTPLSDGECIYYVDDHGNRAVKLKLSPDGK